MPLLLVVAILAYLTLLGLAISSLAARRIGAATALVAPVVGTGVLLPIVLTFNRAGVPIAVCGPPICLALGVLAILCLVLRRPQIPWRRLAPVGPAVGAAIVLTGFPLAVYGLDWLSNANGDMTLYVAVGTWLLHHGFFEVPPLQQLIAGVDASQSAWFWDIAPPNRYGADVFIAIVAAVARTQPLYVYMACCVTAFAMLVMATAALCASERLPRATMPVAAMLLAVASPVTIYSVMQQLLPQVAGFAALVATVALIQSEEERDVWIRRGITLGCALTALVLLYPEISPMLPFGLLIALPFMLFGRNRDDRELTRHATTAAAVLLTIVVLLNVQLPTLLATYRTVLLVGTSLGTIGIINYYLLPAGFANAWGLMPTGIYWEPWLSLAIAIGFVACLIAAVASVRDLRNGRLGAAMLVAVEIACVVLFVRRSSYTLFKMVFLLQPFLAPLVARNFVQAAAALRIRTRLPEHALLATLVLVAFAATAFSSVMYIGAASDFFTHRFSLYSELPGASSRGLMRQIRAIASAAEASSSSAPFRSDSVVNQLSFLEGLTLHGHPVEYVAHDPFGNLIGNAFKQSLPSVLGWPPGSKQRAQAIARRRQEVFASRTMLVSNRPELVYRYPAVPDADTRFSAAAAGARDEGFVIESGPNLTILNRSAAGAAFDVRGVRWHDVRNWLSLVDSTLGRPPNYPLPDGTTALGPVEPDAFDRSRVFATAGRGMLLEVFNPSPRVALKLEVTASLNGAEQDRDVVPGFILVGKTVVNVPADASHGAARLVTPALEPVKYHGRYYLALLIRHQLTQFPERRSGLMSLFGNDIFLDPRRFTIVARDISIADRSLAAPTHIHFDLTSPELVDPATLYRGIYEDGWLSPRFATRLRATTSGDVLRLKLNVLPNWPERTVTLRVDGRRVRAFPVEPGTFPTFTFPAVRSGEHTIELEADGGSAISPADRRPSWGRLLYLGFEPR